MEKPSDHGLKLGIIAGGGAAPGQLIEACRRTHRDYFVVCLEGQAEEGFATNEPHAWVSLGAGMRIKELVAEHNIGMFVMIGHVRRPSLLELKPDWLALKVLTKIGLSTLGDDSLLSGIGKALEEETGARVIGVHEVFTDLLTPRGNLTRLVPDDLALSDIERGLGVVRFLGQADVGQSVIVQQGIVLGVEAVEGTDALIMRSASLRREGPGGILVKMAKPQQDNRFDLPTVGIETIKAVAAAGIRGIAIEAERSLFLDRKKALAYANEKNIFIVGITPDG